MLKSITKLACMAVATAGMTLVAPSAAQAEFPEKPVTLVIPLAAGGSHDLNARIITTIAPKYLGQPMIVRLTPGAGGQKGTQEVARSRADGYTLLFSLNYIDTLQQYVESVPYEPLKDFVPVARINYAPASFIVRADSPYQTFEDLVAAAKAEPGKLRLGHSGNWGAFFVPAAQVMKKLGFEMNLVPYQGGGPAMQALLSGDSDLSLAFPSSIGELLEGGKIRVLASAGETRLYEDVPTFAEIGVPGDIGFMHRFVLAPAGTPQDVLDKLSDVFAQIAQDPEFTTLMERIGEDVHYMTGPEYQALREEQDVEYKALVTELTSQ